MDGSVTVLAMTATATKSLRLKVSELIGLVNPVVIAASPCKPNIVYRVSTYHSIATTFGPLLKRLKKEGVTASRVIVYCRRYDANSNLSSLALLFHLGMMTVAMYTSF